jgi:hypothetical protein
MIKSGLSFSFPSAVMIHVRFMGYYLSLVTGTPNDTSKVQIIFEKTTFRSKQKATVEKLKKKLKKHKQLSEITRY